MSESWFFAFFTPNANIAIIFRPKPGFDSAPG